MGVIRLVVKTQVTDVLKVGYEFFRDGFVKFLDRDLYFLVFDKLVSLVLRRRL